MEVFYYSRLCSDNGTAASHTMIVLLPPNCAPILIIRSKCQRPLKPSHLTRPPPPSLPENLPPLNPTHLSVSPVLPYSPESLQV